MILLIPLYVHLSRLRRRYLAYSYRQLPIPEARQVFYTIILLVHLHHSRSSRAVHWKFTQSCASRHRNAQMVSISTWELSTQLMQGTERTRCSSDAQSRSLPMHFDQLTKTAANDTKAHEPHQRRIQTHIMSDMEDTAAKEGVQPCQMPNDKTNKVTN